MKESDIQKCILDGLAARRIFAFRLNTGGGKVPGGFFRAHTLGKGAADILAFPQVSTVIRGGPRMPELGLQKTAEVMAWIKTLVRDRVPQPLWIEVKAPLKGLRPEQVSFAVNVREQGHHYLVAKDWEDVADWLNEHAL